MQDQLKLNINFDWSNLTKQEQSEVNEIITNLFKSQLWKKIEELAWVSSEDFLFHISIQNWQDWYEWSISFDINWREESYQTPYSYQALRNLVNNAFEHLKIKLSDKIKIKMKLQNMTEALQHDIRFLVEKNINKKLDRYLNNVFEKKDAEFHVELDCKKNKQWLYEWSFRFNVDWQSFVYKNPSPFKYPTDLVSHAFDHLKRELSEK